MFTAYILKSIKDNRYYYGSCENIVKRLLMHNEGKVKSTKGRRPFIIIHEEEFNTRSEAQKREYYFK